MEYKKSRWEKEWDNIKNNKDILVQKMNSVRREMAGLKDGKEYGAKKAELDDMKKTLEKYERAEKNSSKIENVLKFKKDLVENTYDLLDKKNRLTESIKIKKSLEDAITKLDENRQKNFDMFKIVEQKLKDTNLGEEARARLEAEKQTYLRNIQVNDEKYSEIANANEENSKLLSKYDEKQLNDSILKNEKLISKCDLIGANLVKGKSMEEISVALENFKFKPNNDFAKKIQAMRDMYNKETEQKNADKPEQEQPADKPNQEQPVDKPAQEQVITDLTENKPSFIRRIGEFLKGIHPIKWLKEKFSNVKEWMDNIVQADYEEEYAETGSLGEESETKEPETKESETKEPETKESETKESETKEPETKEPETKESETKKPETRNPETKEDFEYAMKYLDGKDDDKVLTEIAEKGVSGFRESIKVDLKEKYKRMKDAAAIDYAIRYKGQYMHQDGINEPSDEKNEKSDGRNDDGR